MADGFDDDMTRCPCCDGEGYFYHGDEPKSPWGDAATIARLTKERDHGTVIEAQLRVKIDRLTAERDEARAEAAAAYERAANEACYACGSQDIIRALATEPGTAALAEIVKKAVDAETRACIAIVEAAPDDEVSIYGTTYIQDRLTARIDQRKEAGE